MNKHVKTKQHDLNYDLKKEKQYFKDKQIDTEQKCQEKYVKLKQMRIFFPPKKSEHDFIIENLI